MHGVKYDSWLPCAYPMEGYVYRVTTAMVQYNPNFWVTPGSFRITRFFLACVFPMGGNGSRITTERPYNPELYYSVLVPLRGRLIGLLRRKGRVARNFTIALTPSRGMFIGPYSPQFTICAYPMKGNASRALTAMVPYTPRVLILCVYPAEGIIAVIIAAIIAVIIAVTCCCYRCYSGCNYRCYYHCNSRCHYRCNCRCYYRCYYRCD